MSRERERVTRRISHLPFIPCYVAKKKRKAKRQSQTSLLLESKAQGWRLIHLFPIQILFYHVPLGLATTFSPSIDGPLMTLSRVYVLRFNPLKLTFIILNLFLFKYICLTWSSPELRRSPTNVIRPIQSIVECWVKPKGLFFNLTSLIRLCSNIFRSSIIACLYFHNE